MQATLRWRSFDRSLTGVRSGLATAGEALGRTILARRRSGFNLSLLDHLWPSVTTYEHPRPSAIIPDRPRPSRRRSTTILGHFTDGATECRLPAYAEPGAHLQYSFQSGPISSFHQMPGLPIVSGVV